MIELLRDAISIIGQLQRIEKGKSSYKYKFLQLRLKIIFKAILLSNRTGWLKYSRNYQDTGLNATDALRDAIIVWKAYELKPNKDLKEKFREAVFTSFRASLTNHLLPDSLRPVAERES